MLVDKIIYNATGLVQKRTQNAEMNTHIRGSRLDRTVILSNNCFPLKKKEKIILVRTVLMRGSRRFCKRGSKIDNFFFYFIVKEG